MNIRPRSMFYRDFTKINRLLKFYRIWGSAVCFCFDCIVDELIVVKITRLAQNVRVSFSSLFFEVTVADAIMRCYNA